MRFAIARVTARATTKAIFNERTIQAARLPFGSGTRFSHLGGSACRRPIRRGLNSDFADRETLSEHPGERPAVLALLGCPGVLSIRRPVP